MIMHELPLLVPACLGLVLAILVPIITLFFCCCRCCCGYCGGKLSTQNVRKHKLVCMLINAFIVVSMVGILSAMACCIPVSGGRLQTSPRLIFRTVNASLDDIPSFLENFVDDASDLTMDVLNTAIDDIKDNLDELPDTLSDPVTDGARPYVDKIESKMDVVSDGIDSLKLAEAQINDTVDAMILYSNNLQMGLNNINGLYSTIKTDCGIEGKLFCGSLPDGSGPDALDVSIDNTKLTDIAVEVTKLVAEANSVNLTEYTSLGNTTFEEVPKTVRNASQDAIDSVKATLDTVQDDLEPEIDKALEAAKFDLDLSDTLVPLDEGIAQLENNKQVVGAVFTVLCCILLTIAMTALAGLMLGVLCTKKSTTLTQTGRTKAGHCGACLLMTSVGLAVFPVLLVLLFGSVLMLLGGNLTIICKPLQDLTVFRRLVDSGLLFGGENLGEKFFSDASLNMSVTNLFKTCRADGTVYTGLNLESVMNLSSMFDPDEFVPDLGDSVVDQINTTIKDISIVDTSLFDDLQSKLDLPDMDLNAAQEVEDELNGIDLEGKAKEINDLADTIPDQIYADKYRAIGTGLQQLHNDSKVPLQQSLENLTTILDGLNSTSQSIKAIITDLSQDLDDLTSYIEIEAVNIVVQTLEGFLNGMKSVPDTLINSVLNELSTDIGRCKVLADVYDIVIASFCDHFLDALNVLWASFYTGGMVCVILMVSSCTVSKYFRRPDDMVYTQHRARQNFTNNSNPSPSSANVDLIYYKSLAEGNASNNAIYPKTNYQRLHKKWRQRRRYITGPFSAQFFGGNRGGTPEETGNGLKETLDQKHDHGPLCTVIELDCSTTDSACCSQSLPSFEGDSSQDTLVTFDQKQKDSNITEGEEYKIVDKVESSVISLEALSTQVNASVEHATSGCSSKSDRNCNESAVFPYFQLNGDEFILIPVSQMKIENHETDGTANEINFEEHGDKQQAIDMHEPKQSACINRENVVKDQWLSSYKIESKFEQTGSSPLVKYSSENEKYVEERNRRKRLKQQDAVAGITFSNLGYIESDHGSDVTENIENDDSELTADAPNLKCDSSDSLYWTGKSLTENKSIDNLDEMEYPVQEIICSLCKGIRAENMNRRDIEIEQTFLAGSKKEESVDVQPMLKFNKVEEENVITRESASGFKTSGFNSEIGILSKSLENSFQDFDDTFQNMSGGNDHSCVHQTGQQMDSNRGVDKKNKNESQNKLDIEVKPYRSLENMRSPQSAFLFWKFIEENCTCPDNVNSWPREKHTGDDVNIKNSLIQDNASGKYVCNDPSSQEILLCEKCPPENDELLPQKEQDGRNKDLSYNEPESLVSLAVTAGKLSHTREENKTFCRKNELKIDSEDVRHPESLASLSMAVSSHLSEIQQTQVHRCEIATT
ncbi:prominin-1-A-like [Mercenaria mercenaria]|uniref:prominin-1-A-like n=1 Tax=Mercenaria mercenaria TaxID=6596 RepID=UPI00234EB1C7|nr:prominin-1-A-like [Mercenaria mercenaria]